jgi:phosphate-selective porin OprO/OprP
VFRRARVGWQGGWECTEYRIEVDFALPGRPSFLDIWAGLNGVPVVNIVRVGHFFEPFSLERLTSNRYVTFMERSLPDGPFAPARNIGIAAFNHTPDARMTWALGVFKEADLFGDNVIIPGSAANDIGVRGGGAVTGRITWLPYWDECSDGRRYVHLGGAGSLRRPDENRVRFAAQPEARLGAAVPNVPAFVDTDWIPCDRNHLVGGEFAWVCGPFSLQSEYMIDFLHRIDGGPNVAFHGWYVTASYFLTGEHRPYKRTMPQGGVFGRVIPNRDFCLASKRPDGFGGPGAWEIAARVSQLDFNDGDIRGGRLTDVTVGLNWYMTPYLRITSNYIRAILDNPVHGRSYADVYAVRVGYDF